MIYTIFSPNVVNVLCIFLDICMCVEGPKLGIQRMYFLNSTNWKNNYDERSNQVYRLIDN